jgi:hypothetical protein
MEDQHRHLAVSHHTQLHSSAQQAVLAAAEHGLQAVSRMASNWVDGSLCNDVSSWMIVT